MVSAQLPAPLHPPPDHPVNADPAAGVAVSVIPAPSSNSPEHAAPQLMPAGEDWIDPDPVPPFATFRLNGSPSARKRGRFSPNVAAVETIRASGWSGRAPGSLVGARAPLRRPRTPR